MKNIPRDQSKSEVRSNIQERNGFSMVMSRSTCY